MISPNIDANCSKIYRRDKQRKKKNSNLPFPFSIKDFALGDICSIPYQRETQLIRRRSIVTFEEKTNNRADSLNV